MCNQRESKFRESHGEGRKKLGKWRIHQISGDADGEAKTLGKSGSFHSFGKCVSSCSAEAVVLAFS